MIHPMTVWHAAILLLVAAVSVTVAAAPDVDMDKNGIDAGLAVHIGSTDGTLEAALTRGGRVLVHGLALGDGERDAARQTLLSRKLYGLASVATWHDRGGLPYASNLVNLLVADLDALGDEAPAMAELQRVVAPEGVLLLYKNGAWSRTVKARPETMDEWGHFDHDPMGLGVSADTLVDPVRQQQWITTLRGTLSPEGEDDAFEGGGGFLISGRHAVIDAKNWQGNKRRVLHCRDAFNGTPLWTVPSGDNKPRSRWAAAAADGSYYTWLSSDGELTELSLATGETLRTFPNTTEPDDVNDVASQAIAVRVAGRHMIVGLRDRLACFDLTTGKERWSFARDGLQTLGPALDAPRNRVYAILAHPKEVHGKGWRSRWPTSRNVASVVAVDLATGRPVWECTDVASIETSESRGKPNFRGVSQLLPGDQHLVVFGSKAIGGGNSPYIGSIDLDTGKLVHQTDTPFKSSYNTTGYNAIWRDGAAWFAGAYSNIWKYDPSSGEVARVHGMTWNQRCTRIAATPRWFIFGQVGYFGPDLGGVQVSVARAGCARPSIPANGLTYFSQAKCGCTTLVNGYHAMTGEPAPQPTADNLRLVIAPGQPLHLADQDKLPDTPITTDWLTDTAATLDPVAAGDIELITLPQQHRIDARRGGKTLWSFLADARISTPPVLINDLAVFGSHDGWVYALSLDGRLRWKYSLAPSQRLIGVHGQIEGTWPVYGVALLDGQIIASAGTHVELDGGVTVAALDPATGRPTWTRHLAKPPSDIPAGGGRDAKVLSYSFINSTPLIQDGHIQLGDPDRRAHDRFTFTPDEDESTLNTRLTTPPAKKK